MRTRTCNYTRRLARRLASRRQTGRQAGSCRRYHSRLCLVITLIAFTGRNCRDASSRRAFTEKKESSRVARFRRRRDSLGGEIIVHVENEVFLFFLQELHGTEVWVGLTRSMDEPEKISVEALPNSVQDDKTCVVTSQVRLIQPNVFSVSQFHFSTTAHFPPNAEIMK